MRVEQREWVEVSLDEWDARARRERVGIPSQEDRFAAYYLRWEAPFWRVSVGEVADDED